MASMYDDCKKSSTIIIVNGVKMTLGDYKASKTPKTKKAKKKSEPKELGVVASEIESMLKSMTALKSIQVYKNHAYRSWGTIANEILAYRGISKPMSIYCVKYRELLDLLEEVQKIAKRNEGAVFQYIDKMAWKLDDMRININDMIKAINESGVCQRFKDHEAINGEGRQLGLGTITIKALRTMQNIDNTIKRLKEIADYGVDAMDYGNHLSYKGRMRMRLN